MGIYFSLGYNPVLSIIYFVAQVIPALAIGDSFLFLFLFFFGGGTSHIGLFSHFLLK